MAVAVLSLAIGIGANGAIFSVINALLLRPLAYQEADRLVILWQRSPGLNVAQDWFSPGQYLDVKAENQVFEQVAVTIGASFNLTGQGALNTWMERASPLRSFRCWARRRCWAESSCLKKTRRGRPRR